MRKQLDRQRVEIEKNKIINRKEIIRQVHLGRDKSFITVVSPSKVTFSKR